MLTRPDVDELQDAVWIGDDIRDEPVNMTLGSPRESVSFMKDFGKKV